MFVIPLPEDVILRQLIIETTLEKNLFYLRKTRITRKSLITVLRVRL